MRGAKHSHATTHPHANVMPDYRFGCFQIGDVLNLFSRRERDLGIHSDGFSVLEPGRLQNRAVKRSPCYSRADRILLWHLALCVCLHFVRLHQESVELKFGEVYWS